MKFILKILKVICWIWTGCNLMVLFTANLTTGVPAYSSFPHILIALIMISPAAAFLIWRFRAEKGLRLQKLQTKEKENLVKAEKNKIYEQNEKLSQKSIQTLMEFKELLSLGIITEEEFNKKKNELLN